MMIRGKWIVPVLGLALLTTACKDKTGPDEDEPEVVTMRLTVGAQTVNVNVLTGAVTGGPITLVANAATPVTAVFLMANGSADPIVTATDFRLDVDNATAGITFTRTGPFAGTLRGTTAGNGSARFGLFAIGHNHTEFQWTVPITITAGAQ